MSKTTEKKADKPAAKKRRFFVPGTGMVEASDVAGVRVKLSKKAEAGDGDK